MANQFKLFYALEPKVSVAFLYTVKQLYKNAFNTALDIDKEEKLNQYNSLVQLQSKNSMKFLVVKDSCVVYRDVFLL